MLAINQTLQGRYRIIRQLGHGGMGAVYEAIDERFGEPIALKEIIIDSVSESQKEIISKAFEREAKSLAKAKHEVVPFVRDYFFELNRQFLVMELVEGEDLGAMLEKRQAPFPLEDVLKWMNQLLDALDYLHNLKPPIIHRDIKPQNLKLSVRNRIKLLDFGIARNSDKSSTTITNQTFVGATLNYSPFEQILRVIDQTFREFIILKHKEKAEAVLSQDTDVRCDIYALGGTFYHLLTNRIPTEATKRTLDVWEGKPDPLPNPSALNPQIPISVSNCLLKALAIERNQRFSSALEMQESLKFAIAESRKNEQNEQNQSAAETIRMFSGKDLKIEMPTETLPQPVQTQSVKTPVWETQPSFSETAPKDSPFVESSNTKPSGQVSNPEFTVSSYLPEIPIEEKKTASVQPKPVAVVAKAEETTSTSTNKLFWRIPIAAVGIFALVGIGGIAWLLIPASNPPVSNKPLANQAVSTPTATLTPVPTTSPTITPTSVPTTTATSKPTTVSTATPTQNKPEKSNPVAVATPNKTPAPAPVKTPQAKATPKPKQDPNCIFTNSCN